MTQKEKIVYTNSLIEINLRNACCTFGKQLSALEECLLKQHLLVLKLSLKLRKGIKFWSLWTKNDWFL